MKEFTSARACRTFHYVACRRNCRTSELAGQPEALNEGKVLGSQEDLDSQLVRELEDLELAVIATHASVGAISVPPVISFSGLSL
jgi:hypothetical protein